MTHISLTFSMEKNISLKYPHKHCSVAMVLIKCRFNFPRLRFNSDIPCKTTRRSATTNDNDLHS